MKRSTTKVTVILVCLVVGVVAYYAYVSGRNREIREEAALTVVEGVLSRDLQKDYPPTPKEVIKYYNEECGEEEITDLGGKARELYDEELLKNNEEEEYFIRLRSDIDSYRAKKKRIASVSVASSTNVDYFEEDGYFFARIYCSYNMTENGTGSALQQVYLLRRDEEKHWKIYGWDLAQNVNPGAAQSEEEN